MKLENSEKKTLRKQVRLRNQMRVPRRDRDRTSAVHIEPGNRYATCLLQLFCEQRSIGLKIPVYCKGIRGRNLSSKKKKKNPKQTKQIRTKQNKINKKANKNKKQKSQTKHKTKNKTKQN